MSTRTLTDLAGDVTMKVRVRGWRYLYVETLWMYRRDGSLTEPTYLLVLGNKLRVGFNR